VGRKAAAVVRAGLVPIICVGETLDERTAGKLEEVLGRQLAAAVEPLPDPKTPMILAYEPVWAIGTGVNATPADASAAHAFLRDRLALLVDRKHAQGTPILYGGSVKPANAAELLGATGVDGLLVGGASLDPAGFARVAAASRR
jgi:triosephosphate isomerase